MPNMNKSNYMHLLDAALQHYREQNPDRMPLLAVGQCPELYFRESRKLNGMFVWWCTRWQHADGIHQWSCRSWS